MRVVHVIESLAPSFGGTAAACAQLANHLVPLGVETAIVTFDGAAGDSRPRDLHGGVAVTSCTPGRPRRLGYGRGLSAAIDGLARPDVMHLHGLWRLSYAQAAGAARRLGVPVIISVNGMLHGRALGQRAAFKQVARWLYQDRVLRAARCLHATAPAEADAIRSAGFDRPVAVVSWGVEMPADDATRPFETAGLDQDPRVILYLGRLHVSKGLETLVRAWAAVHLRFAGWRLVIAGYDDDGYGEALAHLSSAMALDGSMALAGPVAGVDRERLFASASVVVLPSPAENFGFVVPEALARGVPVIATHGAPWSSLADERCGWWVAYGVEPLAAALADALGRAPDELRGMGERGRRFVRGRFAWPQMAASMVELYRWATGRAPEPVFLQG